MINRIKTMNKKNYFFADEEKSREFLIYKEMTDPYNNSPAVGAIKLQEATYCGGDLYIIPMQVYKTDNPLLLKVVCLIANLYRVYTGKDEKGEPVNESVAEINGLNIRTLEMTIDGKIRWHTGAADCPGVHDISEAQKEAREAKRGYGENSVLNLL